MNKEKVAYVKHILGSDFVQLDFFNVIIALSIIVVSFIAFITGRVSFFGIAFILGAVLAFFNMIKSIMKKSAMGVAVFSVMIPVLVGAVVFIFKYLA